MIDLERLNSRLGPLAEIAREYTGPDSTPDQRQAARALVASVLRQMAETVDTAEAARFRAASSWDAEASEVVSRTFGGAAGASEFVRHLGEVRDAVRGDPDAAGLVGIVDVCESFYLDLFAAAQRAERREPEAATALTPAEEDAVRRLNDRLLFETVSPLAATAGGVAAAVGLFAGGMTGMVIAGVVGYVAAAALYEWSFRRVMR